MRNFLALAVVSVMLLTSCATQPLNASVEQGMILPEGAQQTQLKPSQKFLMATPIENRLPDYPPTNAKKSDTTVCVEFVVSSEGSVTSVHQIDRASNCEKVGSAASAEFMPQVYDAVQSWTYFAAAMCEFEKSEIECDGAKANLTPLAIKLAYRFTFSQSNGRRRVSTGAIE